MQNIQLQQQQPQLQVARPELRIKGQEMPKYHGRLDESLELFFFLLRNYCQARSIDIDDDTHASSVISLIAVNLRGAAAVWHQDFV